MVKPYITTGRLPNQALGTYGPTIKNIAVYCILSKGYVLELQLDTLVPHKTVTVSVPGGLPMHSSEREHRSKWTNRIIFKIKMDNEVLRERGFVISKFGAVHETTEEMRARFLDWINMFQATVNIPFDITGATLRAIKWYDTWHNKQIIQDIIE